VFESGDDSIIAHGINIDKRHLGIVTELGEYSIITKHYDGHSSRDF